MRHITPIKSLDSRDYTKKPPAILNPWWVIAIRTALKDFDNHRNVEVLAHNMEQIYRTVKQEESADGTDSN